MRPHEPHDLGEHEPPPRRRDYSLFFFHHEGGRSYLRFTLLGVIASALLFVVPLAGLLILYFINLQDPGPQTNVNVTVLPSPTAFTNTPVFTLPPSRPLPTPRPPPPVPPTPTLEPLNSNAPELVIPTPGRTPTRRHGRSPRRPSHEVAMTPPESSSQPVRAPEYLTPSG
jgi:hypothetical protein